MSFSCFQTLSRSFGGPLLVTVLLQQRILSFSCFQTLSRSFLLSPIDTFSIQKCLETENPLKKTLFSRDLVFLPVSRHFFVRKVSRNSQTTKSLEIMTFQGILLFLLFLDTFHIQGDLSFPLFPDTSTELSAAGAKRGVCKCIRTTIPSRPAGRRPARA